MEKIIDLATWKRSEHFKFFQNADYPQYNICMNIDITHFIDQVKKKKLPFYYAMMYAATITANDVEEFRYRIRKGQVILHDRIHPSFTELSPETDLFKIITVDLEDTLEDFIISAKSKAERQKEYFAFDEMNGRDDLVYITCLPWISFTQISHTISLDKEEAAPRISWGKFYVSGEQVLMPFSVQANHALVDGIHVGRYIEKLQKYLDRFE